MKNTLARTLAAAALSALLMSPARPALAGDIYIVVNATNPVSTLTRNEALDLFMGRSRQFAGGLSAQPLDQARNSTARSTFYRLLTGMDMSQVNSYWARLMFSGQTQPPRPLDNEEAMVEALKRSPGAIGYLTQPPSDKGLTVVLVLRDAPQ
jgi:ABC-type phosphate transport system substrate-binding protein